MNRVVNPPDLAIALNYDGQNAPRVTASGKGDLAAQIIALAEAHGVPLRTDPGLAKVLAEVPLGEEIPRELYLAVAEVIAFAYYLSGKVPEGCRADGEDANPGEI
ncbi:flagellar biosynthesis protein [Methylomagnum ishizawai]|uniref:Flagellar biosynthetic protein FlhB n=1 Tax=Methylomagnum ishizawai TaxID=1760988 RepID=A0A1Y6D1J1_9GAMM|nr:EscU/YscU/HrcU family type III secretion system export apparatus switch protein [Methylomagnum ishizawai]SMF96798.1 flagellar biosynthesis protein [Methylomagnum ishizawai]